MAREAVPSGMVETNTIEFVPLAQRHGKARDLFTLWFTTNIAPLPVVTGAMAVQVYGLSLSWAVSAILLGHMVGATVLAACSAQGPQMGLAQMIQSRGQFGRYGALLVVTFAAVIYVGFFTSNVVLASRSIHNLASGVSLPAGAVLAALAAAAIGIFGYNFIHLLNRLGMWFMGAALLAGFLMIFRNLPPDALTRSAVTPWGWLSTFSLAAVWQISYACYTSDYSRYLPPEIGLRRPFLATYLGAALGASLSFIFGAAAVSGVAGAADPMQAVETATGPFGPVLMLLFIFNIISHNALNIYGAVLSLITMAQTFFASWNPGRTARILLSAAVLVGCLTMATMSAADFVPRFLHFILALMIVLVPWATINIVDFYLVKRGRYDVASFFARDGGVYGRLDGKATAAYLCGVAVQIPFLSTALYVGPIAKALGGSDFGWLIAAPVTGAVYILLQSMPAARMQPGLAETE